MEMSNGERPDCPGLHKAVIGSKILSKVCGDAISDIKDMWRSDCPDDSRKEVKE